MDNTLSTFRRLILIVLCAVALSACTMPWAGYTEKQLPHGLVKLPNLKGYIPICESDPKIAAWAAKGAEGFNLLTCLVNEEKYKRYSNREIGWDEVYPIIYISVLDKNPTGIYFASTADLDLLKAEIVNTYKFRLLDTAAAGERGFTFVKTTQSQSQQSRSNERGYIKKTVTAFLVSNSILTFVTESQSSQIHVEADVIGDLNLWFQEFNRLNPNESSD